MIKLLIRNIFLYVSSLIQKKNQNSCLLIADFGDFGGTKTHFISLLNYLNSNGYHITILLSKNQLDEEIKAIQLKLKFQIELHCFDIWRTKFTCTNKFQKNLLYLKYQLIELNYFWRIAKRLRISRLIISTGNPEWLLFLILSPYRTYYFLHTSTMDKLDIFKRIILKYILSKKRQIIVVSNSSKELILKNWYINKKEKYIKVVYNYFEPKIGSFPNTDDPIPTILTIGSTEYYKNPIFWIEVCKQILMRYHKPIKFVWAGDGSLFNQCVLLANSFPQIKFIGYSRDVDSLYKTCAVYFQPSILESHGIAVLGAMYYSKPCVVSNKGGLVETVIDNITGLIVPIDNMAESVDAILSILNSQDLGEQMGSKGRIRYQHSFSKELWYKKMNLIFEN